MMRIFRHWSAIFVKNMETFNQGVKTNENNQVIREDGSIINNLYAAGGYVVKLIMYSN